MRSKNIRKHICWCKSLKVQTDEDGEADDSGISIYDSYTVEHRWKIKPVSHMLPYGVKCSESNENVTTRIRSFQDKVTFAHVFFQARSERVVSRAHCNPLCVWWLHFQPERNPLPLKAQYA